MGEFALLGMKMTALNGIFENTVPDPGNGPSGESQPHNFELN
jgi:hypothetical protein